mmetsp:Transcript_8480/g.30255  ORF Transcript_8480/g.30255 Transcript_8480/m.30255 type:complete len:93 (-) Transcript_8480:684-962(-)
MSLSEEVLKQYFEQQKCLLDFFFAHIEYDTLVEFANSCLQCGGTIYFTGVGKSGFISKKTLTGRCHSSLWSSIAFFRPILCRNGIQGYECTQ